MAFAVALWPRPAPPAGWISSDGGDAAIVAGGEVVALKPLTRVYATQTWAQRRNLRLPAEPEAAVRALFDCDRTACSPYGSAHPAIAAWWTKRPPKPERLAKLCARADILILRADVPLPWECRGIRVLGRAAWRRGGDISRVGRRLAPGLVATPAGQATVDA
jgi:competence protein ComEC